MSWPALVPALSVPFFCALIYFVWFSKGAAGQSAYGFTKIWVLIFPLFYLHHIGSGGLTRREDRKSNWPSKKVVVLSGIGSGILFSLLGVVMMLSPVGEVVRANGNNILKKAVDLGFKEHFILFALFVSVIHSAMEEYYWRWFVYGHLRKKVGRWFGHALAAIAFSGHHLVVTVQIFPVELAVFLTVLVGFGGFAWTLMYEWHGSVWGCWLSHLIVDAFLMIVAYQLINGGG